MINDLTGLGPSSKVHATKGLTLGEDSGKTYEALIDFRTADKVISDLVGLKVCHGTGFIMTTSSLCRYLGKIFKCRATRVSDEGFFTLIFDDLETATEAKLKHNLTIIEWEA